MKATVICDGRGQAGTGARAAVLLIYEGTIDGSPTRVVERAEKIDPTTNIVAEHLSIQLGIELAIEHGVTDLLVLNDSQTPVFHLLGTYKVKQEHLKPLVEKTWELASKIDSIDLRWVPREKTIAADKLCREVDRPPARRKRPVPLPEPEPRRNPFSAQ